MTQNPQDDPEQQTRPAILPLASLSYRDFQFLWSSSFFANAGQNMRELTNYFQVYELTGSALQLGLLGLFKAVPAMVFGLLGGAMADSFDRKKVILATRMITLVLVLTMGFLTVTGEIRTWHIFVLASMIDSVTSFGRPAQRGMIPKIVSPAHITNAIVLTQVASLSSRLIGSVSVGILIDWTGIGSAYFINAIVFIPAMMSVLAISTSGIPEGPRRGVSLRSMAGGMRFIWSTKLLLSVFLLDFGVTIVGFYRPLLPIISKDIFHIGATGLGMLDAAPAVGAGLALTGLLVKGDVRRKGALYIVVGGFLYAASLGALGVSPWFWVALGAVGALGLTEAINETMRHSMMQIVTPDQLRGRASSVSSLFAGSASSIGAAEAVWQLHSWELLVHCSLEAVSRLSLSWQSGLFRPSYGATVHNRSWSSVDSIDDVTVSTEPYLFPELLHLGL